MWVTASKFGCSARLRSSGKRRHDRPRDAPRCKSTVPRWRSLSGAGEVEPVLQGAGPNCADGYHEIETLMCPIDLYDTLYFKEASSGMLTLACQAATATDCGAGFDGVPCGEENLVMRAVQLLGRRAGVCRGAGLRLVKRIPARAGLGGGSSDAAAALVAANVGWNLGLSPERAEGGRRPVGQRRAVLPRRRRGHLPRPRPGGRARRGTGTVEFCRSASAGWSGHGRSLRRLPAGRATAERVAAGAGGSAAEIYQRRAGCFGTACSRPRGGCRRGSSGCGRRLRSRTCWGME